MLETCTVAASAKLDNWIGDEVIHSNCSICYMYMYLLHSTHPIVPLSSHTLYMWLRVGLHVSLNNSLIVQNACMVCTKCMYGMYNDTSKPHFDHANGPRTENNSIYVSDYVHASFILHLSHTCSWDPCMSWNNLCIPVYWYASYVWLSRHLNMSLKIKDRSWLLIVCHEVFWWRWVGECADTWYSVYTNYWAYWDGGALVVHATAPVWNNRWADCTAVL